MKEWVEIQLTINPFNCWKTFRALLTTAYR